MAGLLYQPGMDGVRRRMTAWWNREDIGRPAMQVYGPPADPPIEPTPELNVPESVSSPNYTIQDFDYRIRYAIHSVRIYQYFIDACPRTGAEVAPNALALFLGSRGVEAEGTVWCEPIFDKPEDAHFELREDNVYWDFSWRLANEIKQVGEGKFMQEFPDLIEGLDTLAALRGTQTLMMDLVDRPDWVHECLGKISQCWRVVYDKFYDLVEDETGGSCFWAWAPGRMVKLQCDFSAMISPEMFGEFMVPVLDDLSSYTDYSMYHWDGPGEIPHHDHLLSIENLDVLQWVPGPGDPPCDAPAYWSMYHKTVDAGKRMLIGASMEGLPALKREFGEKLKDFIINVNVPDAATAEEAVKMVEF
ncbi:MAG: hypothetical protein ACYS8X_13675 [Planctomycetota bacterium]|jgi:5-methyltetrahydrofolate--homocysteine methyltransferase